MNDVSLFAGDNRETMKRMIAEGTRVHSVVTDPPYGLVSITKRFGKEQSKAAKSENNDGSFARLSGGFMGKAWDGTGIERDPDFWKLVYDILLPGGFVFAFSGSRTGHWQACAMEMAGFIMHPMHGWVFGTGFPKAHSASGQLTKYLRPEGGDTHAAALEIEQWEGWAYGTQTQKPAIEPIYLAQKPFSEKSGPRNLLMHGVGALNIDDCRVGSEGRHPSNLLLDGSPEVVAMFPQGKSGKTLVHHTRTTPGGNGITHHKMEGSMGESYGDDGSTSRFFHHFPPDIDPIFYNAKAGSADRGGSKHPTVKPVALMQYLIRHITPPGGTILDPFAGSGTTAQAAINEGFDCILMEAEDEYVDFLRDRFDLGGDLGIEFDFSDIFGVDDQSTKSYAHDFSDILG
jgi:DNA modification methylase